MLRGSKKRYFFLPGFLDVPDLIVDLQQLQHFTMEEAVRLTDVVELDSPFSEALVSQFSHRLRQTWNAKSPA